MIVVVSTGSVVAFGTAVYVVLSGKRESAPDFQRGLQGGMGLGSKK
jgi:hypothetical protein